MAGEVAPPEGTQLERDVAPWSGSDGWTILGYILASQFLVVVLLLATNGRRVTEAVAFVFSQAAMAAAVWYVLCARKKRPLATLGVRRPDVLRGNLFGLVLGGMVASMLLTYAGVLITTVFYERVLGHPPPHPRHFIAPGTPRLLEAVMVFGAVVGAPVSEELLFRGFLFRWLRAKRTFRFAALVSAAIFSAAHLEPSLFLSRLGMGLTLAYVVELSSSLYPAMLLHALVNLVATVAQR